MIMSCWCFVIGRCKWKQFIRCSCEGGLNDGIVFWGGLVGNAVCGYRVRILGVVGLLFFYLR